MLSTVEIERIDLKWLGNPCEAALVCAKVLMRKRKTRTWCPYNWVLDTCSHIPLTILNVPSNSCYKIRRSSFEKWHLHKHFGNAHELFNLWCPMLFKPWDLQQQEMNFVYKRTKYRNTIAGLLKKNSKNKK